MLALAYHQRQFTDQFRAAYVTVRNSAVRHVEQLCANAVIKADVKVARDGIRTRVTRFKVWSDNHYTTQADDLHLHAFFENVVYILCCDA